MPIDPAYLHLVHPDVVWDCFLYGRNSVDPKKKGRSVADQLKDGQGLADQYGWPVKDVFKDTGISASRHARKKRDDFEDMLARIEAREVRIVVAFEASRYYRDLEAYVRLRNACYSAGVLLCYNGQVYDLSKRADRKATAMDAVSAEDEVEGIRDRNLRTTRENAEKGGPHGPTPYGYRRIYDPDTGDLVDQIPDPKQAKNVVKMFEDVKAGKSLRGIAEKMNESGEVTRLGKRWVARSVYMVLRNKAYLGKRLHKGVEYEGTWEGLVKPKLFDEVQVLLDGRLKGSGGSTAVKHLLSGLALCGVHGGMDPAQPDLGTLRKTTTARGRWVYRCNQLDLSVNADLFQAYVEEGVVAWMRTKEAAAAFRKPKDGKAAAAARARLKAIDEQLLEAREAAGQFDENGQIKLSALSLASIEKSLSPLRQKAEADLKRAEATIPAILRDLLGNPMADEVWDGLDLHQQRFVLKQVVTVRLFKARAPGVKRIEPGRVTLSFYGQEGFVPVT
ncbi:recombinase family protein [Streptomyces vilmorinianum]|uniref:recombinase family protein n=1 Tax=Streptomyces vilmorinianum TaxID=3051092 RepID=UPI0010FB3393|nr:recombinase family protein [Streptomyces vilmorinianum]